MTEEEKARLRVTLRARAASASEQPTGGSSVNRQAVDELKGNIRNIGDTALATASGVVNGVIPFRDELTGLKEGLDFAQAIPSVLEGEGFGFGERYEQGVNNARANNAEAEALNPTAYNLGNIGGQIGLAVGSLPAAAGKTILGTIGKAVGIGGGEGLYHALGNLDGEEANAMNVGVPTALGAVLGAGAIPAAAAVRGAGRVAKNIGGRFAGAITGGEGYVDKGAMAAFLQNAMNRAGETPQSLQRQLFEAARDGQGEMAAAHLLPKATTAMTNIPSEGAEELARYLDEVQAGQKDRIAETVVDQFNAGETAQEATRRLTQERRAETKPLYDAAAENAGPVNLNDAIDSIDTLLGRDPIMGDGASSLSQGALGRRLMSIRSQMQNDGEQLIDFKRVQDLRTDLRRTMERTPAIKSDLQPVYDELTNALSGSSDEWRGVNDRYREMSQVIDAVNAGEVANRAGTRATDNINTFNNLSPDAQDAFRTGYGSKTLERVEGAAEGVNSARPFTSPKSGMEREAFANNPEEAASKLAREDVMFATRQRAMGGSRTAENEQLVQDYNANLGILAAMMRNSWGSAAAQATAKGASFLTGRNEATNSAIARALLSKNPVQELTQVMDDTGNRALNQKIAEAIVRNSARSQSDNISAAF